MITSCFYQYIAIFWTWILFWKNDDQFTGVENWKVWMFRVFLSSKWKEVWISKRKLIKVILFVNCSFSSARITSNIWTTQLKNALSSVLIWNHLTSHVDIPSKDYLTMLISWAGSIWRCWYHNPGIFDDVGCWYQEYLTMLISRARGIRRCWYREQGVFDDVTSGKWSALKWWLVHTWDHWQTLSQ